MKQYLFLILDRYEASLSESFKIESTDLSPKKLFKDCLQRYAEWDEEQVKDISNEICCNGKFVTHDSEEVSFLLIKL
jgi:hypothetical protein